MTSDQMQLPVSSEESIPSFIRKTYKILEDQDNNNFDVISWNDEGTAIVIKNPTEFAQTILPTYFKHNNLNSFIRQLNMYDFHKKKTPDGEHVYYHELFQRGKKHLLKNIRRKNAESSVLNTEKSRLGLELAKSKQDIAAIVNENLFLKKVQSEAIVTINGLEEKVRELNAQNQALWAQLMKYNEKEEALRSLVPTFKRDIPLNPLSNIDINTNQFSGENIPNKIAQTTTRIPQFSNDMINPRSWNFTPENFDGSNIPGFYNNMINENNNKQGDNELKRKKGPKSAAMKGTNYLESDFASDLSQQIVKNMDQELQYLKKLTSSNKRPAANLSLSNSPDSSILGKRRIETDPGLPNLTSFENLTKIYKPDQYSNVNLLPSQCKAEGGRDSGQNEE